MKGNKDDFDDMMENFYRATLAGLKYKEPKKEVHHYAYESQGEHSWMRM